ncbi:peroxisomal sarcosine oxidase [Biomphalaria pfeifferi]|uniref:Peroxisomal sarcosine oxidase n=1 Tax=Biomphalaria pfeifferi TaxID=112525 RepID=A0AAD8CBH2_BIOPF|nr:peroxisomal sarcosine oxidase [Biomphalaria pfeifferi]
MSNFCCSVVFGFSTYRNTSEVLKTTRQFLKLSRLLRRGTMDLSSTIYDAIVVGAGIEGSSIAYNLAKRGQRTLLIEQFPLPHSRGSSHGKSRITRYAYEKSFYVRMMVDAFPMWAQLEKEAKTRLFVNCGLLNFYYNQSEELERMTSALREFQVPHQVLTSTEVQSRFPQIKNGEDYCALWDPHGGALKADKCLKAFQDVFQQHGGVVHDEEPVTHISPGKVITVATTKSHYLAHNVVIAAGPWSEKLCMSLKLQVFLKPLRSLVLYWKVNEEFINLYDPDSFPCFIDSRTSDDVHMYGFPSLEYPGMVKICLNRDFVIDPDDRDELENDGVMTEEVKKKVALTFKHLASMPSIREYCICTDTPDKHPYIDKHPAYPNIVLAAGFSGHGFKLAPAVGKAVTELVLKEPLSYNMEPFKLNRFTTKANL